MSHKRKKLRKLTHILTPGFRGLGHSGSVFTSSIESILCGRQVVENSGFDQLQNIYKRHCLLDRCAGTNFLQNAPKSTKLDCRFALLVVIDIYNFD